MSCVLPHWHHHNHLTGSFTCLPSKLRCVPKAASYKESPYYFLYKTCCHKYTSKLGVVINSSIWETGK